MIFLMIEICQICGESLTRRHVRGAHGINITEYRKRFPEVKGVGQVEPKEDIGFQENQVKMLPKPKSKAKKKRKTSKKPSSLPQTKPPPPSSRATSLGRIIDYRRKSKSIKLLHWLEDNLVNGKAAQETVRDVVVSVLSQDSAKIEAVQAALTLNTIERLVRMGQAVGAVEAELFSEERIKGAKTPELVAVLQLISTQQERSLKFLEKIFAGVKDDPSTYIIDQSQRVYVDSQDKPPEPVPQPGFLKSSESREHAAAKLNKLLSLVQKMRESGGRQVECDANEEVLTAVVEARKSKDAGGNGR